MVLDIIFVVFIVVFTVLGFICGLFKTFVSFFGWFISFVLSYLCAKALANAFLSASAAEALVSGSDSIFAKIYEILPDGLKGISMDSIRAALAADQSEAAIKESIASQADGLLKFASSIIQEAVCKPMYLGSAVQNVAQVLALELTYHLYVILVGVIFFVVLRIIVMGVSIIVKNRASEAKKGKEKDVLKLPQRLGGLALGAIRGFAYGCVLLMLASYLSGIMSFVQQQVDESQLSVPITSWISETTGAMLSDNLEENENYLLIIDAFERQLAAEEGV